MNPTSGKTQPQQFVINKTKQKNIHTSTTYYHTVQTRKQRQKHRRQKQNRRQTSHNKNKPLTPNQLWQDHY